MTKPKAKKDLPRLWTFFLIPVLAVNVLSLFVQNLILAGHDRVTFGAMLDSKLPDESKELYKSFKSFITQRRYDAPVLETIHGWISDLKDNSPNSPDLILFYDELDNSILASFPNIKPLSVLPAVDRVQTLNLNLKSGNEASYRVYFSSIGLYFGESKHVIHLINGYNLSRIESKSSSVFIYVFVYTILLVSLTVIGMFITSLIVQRPLRNLLNQLKDLDPDNILKYNFNEAHSHEFNELQKSMHQVFVKLHKTIAERRKFNSDLAHQLRTPLTVLILQLDKMIDSPDTNPEFLDSLKEHYESIKRYAKIIDSLLMVSKLESMDVLQYRREIDLSGLVSDCIDLFVPLFIENQIQCDIDLDYALRVVGDDRLLAQAFCNIIDNAFKYGAVGKKIIFQSYLKGNLQIVSIRNFGPVIEANDIRRIFDRFYRAHEKVEGFGIGLNLAQKIVEIHGGTIEVESSLEEGTVFRIVLDRSFF